MDRIKVITDAVEKLETAVAAMIEQYGEPAPVQTPVQQTTVQTEPSSSQIYSTASARSQSSVTTGQNRGSYSNAAPTKRSSFKDLIGLGRGGHRNDTSNNFTRQRP